MKSEDESGDAIFMVQPEEMGCYKSLRRVVDEAFTTRGRFLPNSMMYTAMDYAEDGINRQLREMLFIPSKRTKRGVRRADNECRDSSANLDGLSATKQTQRQSKQKERCENRLLSLLFATVYDPATKRCRLVQDVPPLKLRKVDRSGQVRNVSNYTDVRLYLRNAMTSILSTYSESVKTLNQLLPHHFGMLPSLFVIITRVFMAIAKIDSRTSPNQELSEVRTMANNALDYCMDSIQSFITTWERRNFSTDNPLLHCLDAGTNNDFYNSARKLLQSMIDIVPPVGLEPVDEQFRWRYVHNYGSPSGSVCQKSQSEQCVLGSKCPGRGKPKSQTYDTKKFLQFVSALSEYAKLPPAIDFDASDRLIDEGGFSTATWRVNEGLCILHRMETFSSHIQSQKLKTRNTNKPNSPCHLEQASWDIARYWSAIGRSNFMTWKLLNKLNISDPTILKETAVELIFGGAIASIALFERENEILPICEKLRSKKGPMVVNMTRLTSSMEKVGRVIPSLCQTPEVNVNGEVQSEVVLPTEDVQASSRNRTEEPSKSENFNEIDFSINNSEAYKILTIPFRKRELRKLDSTNAAEKDRRIQYPNKSNGLEAHEISSAPSPQSGNERLPQSTGADSACNVQSEGLMQRKTLKAVPTSQDAKPGIIRRKRSRGDGNVRLQSMKDECMSKTHTSKRLRKGLS